MRILSRECECDFSSVAFTFDRVLHETWYCAIELLQSSRAD